MMWKTMLTVVQIYGLVEFSFVFIDTVIAVHLLSRED